MAISKKYRRGLELGGRSFLWWVYEDLEACGAMTLKVASKDKKLLVQYQLDQVQDVRYLFVLGPEFPGLRYSDGALCRVRCPRFHDGDTVKPADVRKLIEWCLDPRKAVHLVNWRGDLLSEAVLSSLEATAREKPSTKPLQRTRGRRVPDRVRSGERRGRSHVRTRTTRRR
jgi:hypothetical protein